MNMPSSTMVGTSSTRASQRSSSSNRWRRGGGASPNVVSIAWTAIADLSGAPSPGVHRGRGNWDGITSAVALLEFLLGPLHRVLCGHALHRLGVHVGDDVLGPNLGGLRVGRPGEARCLTQPRRHLVGGHHRVLFPQLVLFPGGGTRRGEA